MYTILVVEDEQYARSSLIKQIKEYDIRNDFKIIEATDGLEGLDLFRQFGPDLVLTDIRMSKIDGIELLKRCKEEKENAKIVMVSAYSDFNYAKEALSFGAMDYLLKPVKDKDLKLCLDKAIYQKNRETTEALLTGKDIITKFISDCIQKDNFKNEIEEKMFQRIFPQYQIAVIYLLKDSSTDTGGFLNHLSSLIGPDLLSHFRFLGLRENFWVILLGTDDNIFFCRQIYKVLSDTDYKFRIGISERSGDSGKVREVYNHALSAVKYKIISGSDIIYFEKTVDNGSGNPGYPRFMKGEFVKSLEQKNELHAISLIADIFDQLKKSREVSVEYLEYLLNQVVFEINQQITTDTDLLDIDLKKTILDFNSVNELKDYLISIIHVVCTELPVDKKDTDVVSKMIEYANSHYNQDITVKMLADRILFMNQDYISHLFVTKQGISFSAWLRTLRITRAEELLKTQKLSITDIGMKIGYNDTSQFIRIFKQETGLTPKKYRELYGKTT
jgi:two-component system response regulator YesN